MPDIDLGNAICAATNDWLAAKWLGDANQSARFLGSIRINPIDSHAAVREIERWADHPAMVQVAVPLEAHRPYGQRNYAPIWETAARNSLPIAVHSDGGAGVDFFVTANGYPRHHIEYSTLMPINFIYHLTSLIAEGTFERIPGLKFVFADGGHDVLAPLMWRMDMDWPISGMQTPWVSRRPSEYLRTNVRFITNLLEGPHGRVPDEEWLNVSDAEALLLYGSNYPQWSYISPEFARSQMPAKVWTRVARDNALSFYGPRLS
jgi:predicted TIM-barrel fold metal-dependent hydrolase